MWLRSTVYGYISWGPSRHLHADPIGIMVTVQNFQPHKGGHRARGPPGDLHGNAIGVKVTPL